MFIHCVFVVESTQKKKQETKKKTWKNEKKKRKKDNLILSHVNFICLLTQIGPYAFTHTHCTFQKQTKLM